VTTTVPTIVLSEREKEVLLGLSFGVTNEDMADKLHISVDTVKTHNRRLFRKLMSRDRAHATRIGFELGLLTPRVLPLRSRVEKVAGMLRQHTDACWAAEICPCRVAELRRRGGVHKTVSQRIQELLLNRRSFQSDALLLTEIARLVGLDESGLTA
jgi:DNA-binding CsgD family transcriptional regulator